MPALGIVSSIIRRSRRRPIFGYTAMVLSLRRDRRSSASACGCTTCSRPGCRSSGSAYLHRREHDDRDPDRRADLLLDRDAVARPAAVRHAAAVRARLLRHLRHRRPDGRDAGVGADSTCRCTTRIFVVAHFHYVLIGGARVPADRRRLLLVSEDDRPNAGRAAGQVELLDAVHRLQRHLLPACTSSGCRACRGASTPIPRRRLGHAESDLHGRRGTPRDRGPAVRLQRAAQLRRRASRRRQSVECRYARVGPSSPPPPYNFAPVARRRGTPACWDRRGPRCRS